MELTHFNKSGRAQMVDVSEKNPTVRQAVAMARISMNRETLGLIQGGAIGKGDVLAVAQVAGIGAAKRTWELIPMCHPIPLTGVDIAFTIEQSPPAIAVTATVSTSYVTGVEMEALTAATTAALTIYDMCKAVQKDMVIGDVLLVEKTGGKSGDYRRDV